MSIAARFRDEVGAAERDGLDGPELLPDRLARAATAMLPIDGAGVSLLGDAEKRVPLGASSPVAATAERLQFTVGDGPCIAAQRTGAPVLAAREDLHRRWPEFTAELEARTPYRGIVGLPLQQALAGIGAIDLYFEDGDRIADLDVFEALAVGELITTYLSEVAVFSTWSADEGPPWMNAPAPRRRARVWKAMGQLSLALDVDGPTALSLLRTHANRCRRDVDDVAADLLGLRIPPEELFPAGTQA